MSFCFWCDGTPSEDQNYLSIKLFVFYICLADYVRSLEL